MQWLTFIEREQSALAFKTILDASAEAGLVSRQSRQRLDWTQMFGWVSHMSRLDCVRERLRLALQELQGSVELEARPEFWSLLPKIEPESAARLASQLGERKILVFVRLPQGISRRAGPDAHDDYARTSRYELAKAVGMLSLSP